MPLLGSSIAVNIEFIVPNEVSKNTSNLTYSLTIVAPIPFTYRFWYLYLLTTSLFLARARNKLKMPLLTMNRHFNQKCVCLNALQGRRSLDFSTIQLISLVIFLPLINRYLFDGCLICLVVCSVFAIFLPRRLYKETYNISVYFHYY